MKKEEPVKKQCSKCACRKSASSHYNDCYGCKMLCMNPCSHNFLTAVKSSDSCVVFQKKSKRRRVLDVD